MGCSRDLMRDRCPQAARPIVVNGPTQNAPLPSPKLSRPTGGWGKRRNGTSFARLSVQRIASVGQCAQCFVCKGRLGPRRAGGSRQEEPCLRAPVLNVTQERRGGNQRRDAHESDPIV